MRYLAVQIGEALAVAHAAGVVHRDIKPENIMVRRDGYLKVLDFGLAKLTESRHIGIDTEAATRALLKTNPGMVMGTVTYMSPEQARGREIDARTDIWSLGVLIYEMLTGQVPFAGETPTEVLARLIEREPVPISLYAPGLPAELQRIIHQALAKEREERYQTSKDMLTDLKAFKQQLEFSAQLERSGAPSSFGVPPSDEASQQSKSSPFGGTTNGHSTSSAEYLVNEIRRHKRGALFASAMMILAIAAIVYFSYFGRSHSGDAIDSLAVLPLVNVSNDPNTEYLSDGISDSIIDSLSHLPNLKRVVPFSSVIRFKGKQAEPLAVGRELNVRAVLTGRLTQHGDDLLISTELLDAKDNKRLWGEQYDRKLADMPKLQGEIARDISEKLRLRLTGEQREQLTKRYTENSEAYQLYLQGRYYRRKGTDEGHIKSVEYLQKAIEKDPNFALGYAGLSDSYLNLAVFGQMPPKEAWQKAEEAAVKALAIDDGLGEAHFSLGRIKWLHDWDWAGAEREFKLAIELNQESADSHAGYASLLGVLGRFDEAIAEAKRAQQLDPLSVVGPDLAEILYFARRYDEAVAEGLKRREEGNKRPSVYLDLGDIYVQQGRYEEALAEMLKARNGIEGSSHSEFRPANKDSDTIRIYSRLLVSSNKTVPQTSRSDTQIRHCMHGMQPMHVHVF